MDSLAPSGGARVRAPVFSLFHGPDRTAVPADGGPFHGIAPRSFVDCVEPDAWRRHAHRLFDDDADADEELSALRELARQNRVLSFAQSARAAQRYIETRLNHGGARCDLWNIKEGHTSSVWHVSWHGMTGTNDMAGANEAGRAANADGVGNAAPSELILNIARDEAAGRELARTARTMQAISARYPDIAMAKVEDLAEVTVDHDGQAVAVTVTRNQLVRDALEIHLGRDRRTGDPVHVLVSRFVTDTRHPSQIVNIAGRYMTQEQCAQLEADQAAFLAAASQVAPVAIDINDGDLVWDGNRAVVVAIR